MSWIAAAIGGAGLVTGLVGANKQAKANQSAQAQNAQLQEQQNQSAWAAYLMQRGVDPTGVATGQLPTAPKAVNTKLPLWANVRRNAGGSYAMARPMGDPATAPASSLGGRTWEGLGIRL